jgi:hypothetical protein
VFALDLESACEGEHTIFGLLGLVNLAQDDVLHATQFFMNTLLNFSAHLLVMMSLLVDIQLLHTVLLGRDFGCL